MNKITAFGAALAIDLAPPLLATPAFAAPVEIKVGQPLPRFANLNPGVRRYLRHRQMGSVLRGTERVQRHSPDAGDREVTLAPRA